ncbi:MAG: hypothetical protein ACP5HU_02510 [Phycisphaerae bacterium]
MSREEISRHCREINRCNQRGGRMLSVVDLIEAGTISRDLAAYSLAAIGSGASFLVGAVPGGAGKTTVMCALLNFVPPDVQLSAADSAATIKQGARNTAVRRCYICHEIGRGQYYAYLWGEELQVYFELPTAGHMLATNLHADTYRQARSQIVDECGVAPQALRRMNLMYFLSVRGGQRRIESVHESDGTGEHKLVYVAGTGTTPAKNSTLVTARQLESARRSIDRVIRSEARTIEEVRSAVLENQPEA